MKILYLFFISFSYAKGFPSDYDYEYYFDHVILGFDHVYEGHDLNLSQKEDEHEASSENVELDEKCLKSTHLMMSNIRVKIKEMKDCFLTPEGSIADMESMSVCTATLEKTVKNFWQETLYTLYHPGINSDQGES